MRLVLALVFVLSSWIWAPTASAALPPFELVKKSVAQARAERGSVRLDLRITRTQGDLEESRLAGTFDYGDVPEQIRPTTDTALQLLWIALLAPDPISAIQKRYAVVKARATTVGVQEEFVYVYGAIPAVSVFRDLRRLAAFTVDVSGERWVVRLAWDEDRIGGVMITRGGRTVLRAVDAKR